MNLNGQVVPNRGRLIVEVWPTYIGVAESSDGVTLTEQAGHPDYLRGQIAWDATDDGILGRARVLLPKGTYTHLLFCHGPVESVIGVERFEHPVVFTTAGVFDVSPIRNRDYLPR